MKLSDNLYLWVYAVPHVFTVFFHSQLWWPRLFVNQTDDNKIFGGFCSMFVILLFFDQWVVRCLRLYISRHIGGFWRFRICLQLPMRKQSLIRRAHQLPGSPMCASSIGVIANKAAFRPPHHIWLSVGRISMIMAIHVLIDRCSFGQWSSFTKVKGHRYNPAVATTCVNDAHRPVFLLSMNYRLSSC